jgi:hypothetical protein
MPARQGHQEAEMHTKKLLGGALVGGALIAATAAPVGAATSTDRVSETNMRDGYAASPSASDTNWYREDTRVGGGVTQTKDFGAPTGFGDGALALTDNNTTSAKAQLMTSSHVRGTLLATVTGLDYWTYQSSTTSPVIAAASYQLVIDPDGDPNTANTTTLVYEPYQGGDPQPLAPDVWQHWDATNRLWWSTKDISCNGGAFTVAHGSGGPANAAANPLNVGLNCPGATVLEVGVDVGSFNPNYTVAVDGLHLQTATDSYTWDFGPK